MSVLFGGKLAHASIRTDSALTFYLLGNERAREIFPKYGKF